MAALPIMPRLESSSQPLFLLNGKYLLEKRRLEGG